MQDRNIAARQMSGWLAAASVGPLLQIAGATAWPSVIATGGLCLGLWAMAKGKVWTGQKWLCFLQILWLGVVLASAGERVAECWPTGRGENMVMIVLLGLSAAAVSQGSARGARAAGTVFWLLGLTYIVVVGAGVGEVAFLPVPERSAKLCPELLNILLLPLAGMLLPEKEGRPGVWVPVVCAALAVGASLLVGAALGVTAQTGDAVLTRWIRGLGLFGTFQRFEALVSAGLTVSWFCYLSYLLNVAGGLAEQVTEGARPAAVWLVAAGATLSIVLKLVPGKTVVGVGCVILWAGPLLWSVVGTKIKIKKRKNNA